MAVKCWNPQGSWMNDKMTVLQLDDESSLGETVTPIDFSRQIHRIFPGCSQVPVVCCVWKDPRLSSKPPRNAAKGSKHSDFSEDGLIRMVFGFDWAILCCIPDFTGSCFAGMETGAVDMWQLMNDMNITLWLVNARNGIGRLCAYDWVQRSINGAWDECCSLCFFAFVSSKWANLGTSYIGIGSKLRFLIYAHTITWQNGVFSVQYIIIHIRIVPNHAPWTWLILIVASHSHVSPE